MTAPARIIRRPLQQETSRQAFRDHGPSLKARILAYLATVDGAADHEMEQALDVEHSALSGDRSHLAAARKVYASRERRPTPRGRPAIVWKLGRNPEQHETRVPPFVRPNECREQLSFEGLRP